MKALTIQFALWLLTSASFRALVREVVDSTDQIGHGVFDDDDKFSHARREILERMPDVARWLVGYAIESIIAARRVQT